MQVRFTDVDWFCDNCNTYLNNQCGFDDRKYIWKCKKCGYKNSISAANIRHENPVMHNVFGFLLGYIRSYLVYAIAVLIISEIIRKQEIVLFFGHRLFLILALSYPVVIMISLFFERAIAKYGIHKPLGNWIISTIPCYFVGDCFRPLREVLTFPFALLNLLRLKIKGISFTKYFRKKCFYATTYLILLLLIALLFWKSGACLVFS